MVPPRLAPFRGNAQGKQQGRRHVAPTEGGVQHTQRGGVQQHPRHVPAGVVRVCRPRPADPNRASGAGKDGSDPPFFRRSCGTARGGCITGCNTRRYIPPPPSGGVAPVPMYPGGKAPRPAHGPDDEQTRAAPCLTDSSARSWSSAASVSRPPGRGPARFPRPIPWRCSSATTPRTCTAPSSRGTTWLPAWRRGWPANFSSAHPGIWFARMGVSLGLRSRLPTRPLSPSADGWRGCRSGHRRQGPIWTSVRGAGVKADSLAPRGRSGARRLDAGEHTRMVLARRCRQ